MEYRQGSHTKYKIEYHFVWVTKYRYAMLVGDLAIRVRELVRQTCERYEIQILRGFRNIFRIILNPNLMTASMSSREPAAQPAGIAGLSVRDFKPTDFKSVVV